MDHGGATVYPSVSSARNNSFNFVVWLLVHCNSFVMLHFKSQLMSDTFNLHLNCAAHELAVKPVAGKAILWYNHFLDATGQLGELDPLTLHGSCPVLKGEKWIANFWIRA